MTHTPRHMLATGDIPIAADFACADLRRADLRGADFACANLYRADLAGADLTGAKGLPTP